MFDKNSEESKKELKEFLIYRFPHLKFDEFKANNSSEELINLPRNEWDKIWYQLKMDEIKYLKQLEREAKIQKINNFK